jgi:ubiquitin-activating enzyme E1
MVELNSSNSPARPVKVLTPFTFTIEDTTLFHPYTGTKGYFQQVIRGKFFEFKPLAEVLHKDVPISNDNWQNEKALHLLTLALGVWRQQHGGRFPRVDDWADAKEVAALAQKLNGTPDGVQPAVEGLNEWLLVQLARVASCELNPLCALMGGVLGQEVLKGASGKFVPVQQFYYYDGSHVLPSEAAQKEVPLDLAEHRPHNSRYDGQIGVFGAKFQRKLQAQSYFVVGAGAIGWSVAFRRLAAEKGPPAIELTCCLFVCLLYSFFCQHSEMVKNFALMGLGTGKDDSTGKVGAVHITDMDTIERSNLNRQFLFRNEDVGAMKSVSAARAVKRMNPSLNIHAQSLRVGPSTEEFWNDDFWNGLDGVVTALDNVEARIYVDQRCVYYQKPMIDSGTLGTKGSTQVVVPFLTESYGSSRDAPEESIPICTLKNFPHKIEHTIQWARDHFEGLFKAGPSEVNNYLTQPSYLAELAKQQNQQLQSLQTIKSYLVDDKPSDWAACLRWARLLFEDEYHYKIAQLLHNFPVDSSTAEGMPFWSGTKRPPVVIHFDVADPTHLSFVLSAATLRAQVYNLPVSKEVKEDLSLTRSILASVKPGPFVPAQNAKIAATEAEAKEMMDKIEDDHENKVQQILAALPKPEEVKGYHLQPIDFEKVSQSIAQTHAHAAALFICRCIVRSAGSDTGNAHSLTWFAPELLLVSDVCAG